MCIRDSSEEVKLHGKTSERDVVTKVWIIVLFVPTFEKGDLQTVTYVPFR